MDKRRTSLTDQAVSQVAGGSGAPAGEGYVVMVSNRYIDEPWLGIVYATQDAALSAAKAAFADAGSCQVYIYRQDAAGTKTLVYCMTLTL